MAQAYKQGDNSTGIKIKIDNQYTYFSSNRLIRYFNRCGLA